jgi:hypothetical protein
MVPGKCIPWAGFDPDVPKTQGSCRSCPLTSKDPTGGAELEEMLQTCIREEECCLLGCDTVWLLQHPTFRKERCSYFIIFTLMIKAIRSPKRRFLTEPRIVTSQKAALFIFTTVKTSYLTCIRQRLGFNPDQYTNILTAVLADSFRY